MLDQRASAVDDRSEESAEVLAVTDTLYPLTIAVFLLAWVVGAWLVGVTAGNRGFNSLVWGLVSLVISPFVGIILLMLVTPRTGPRMRP
jgi:uncharacterized membrane protein YhdT